MAEQASQSPPAAAADDPLPEALALAQGAADAGLGLKLLGGLAVRVICPELPPRQRAGQDMDFACLSRGRKDVAAYLERAGCIPDKRFNNLNGDRQMYFNSPSGRPVDVMVDRLTMCHVLDFRPSFGTLPLTLSAIDILLSKLQIVELNEKDVRDCLQLLAGVPLAGQAATADGPALDTDRFEKIMASDWGWWRTVTGNLEKLPSLAADKPELIPPGAPQDPLAQAALLLERARSVPKGMKWKVRSNVGDRVRWYELPEEVGH
ncbi:MAG TPA: hypothetical protein VEL03_18010 [Streptosporangiaceae bacterium]|nr:hypothetical protein [Streptosporangiaceae bacterium]